MSGPVLPDSAVRAASEHVERVVAGLALPRGRRRELRDEMLDHILCETESRTARGAAPMQAVAAATQLSYRALISSAVAAAAADRIRRAAVIVTLCSTAWILVWSVALRDAPRLPWTEVRETSLLANSGDLARATPWLALAVGLALTVASNVRASRLPALIRASHLAAASWMVCAGSAAVYGFARLSLAPHSVGDAIKLALVLVFLITSAVFVAETAAWRGAKVLRRYVRDGVREAVRIGTGT